MNLINLLISIPSIGNFGSVAINNKWIVDIITWIINVAGDVGLGIIIFTAILKLITLPFDIMSRVSMKKNELKMELMQEDLEKLQKQYKKDSQLYQQKMMALQKKNGYNPLSACLPTILTLIFFIVVINAFNAYSRFADKDVFNKMGEAYDASLYTFTQSGVLVEDEQNKKFDLVISKALGDKYSAFFNYDENSASTNEEDYTLNFEKLLSDQTLVNDYPELKDFLYENGLSYTNKDIIRVINEDCSNYIVSFISSDKIKLLESNGAIVKENNGKYSIRDTKALATGDYGVSSYFVGEKYDIDYEKIIKENSEIENTFNVEGKKLVGKVALNKICESFIENTVKKQAREASAQAYELNASRSKIFPWIKNLWVVDSPMKAALPSIQELKTSIGAENMGSLEDEEVYKELTYNLGAYKNTGFGKGNGLFILVALSILSMLGSTIISSKTQKLQRKLSSVEGENSQAAMSSKMMTWMLPIMFSIFAFIYSAAFSIYMTTSTLLSTICTLLTNLIVERVFKNKMAKIEEEKQKTIKYGKRRD